MSQLIATTQVGEVMTKEVITANENDTLNRLVHLFKKHHIRHIPIVNEEEVLGIIGSRENKVKTRPELEPTNRFGSPEATVEEFKKLRKTKIDFIKTTDQDLRNRYFDFPFGKVDTYQLVLFISGHTVRHIDQIKEILADDSFPNT